MKAPCPTCRHENENAVVVEEMIRCQGCGEWFRVLDVPPVPTAFGPEVDAPTAPIRPLTPEETAHQQREGIRNQAFLFSLLAALLAIGGGFTLFAEISGQSSSTDAWVIAGALWGAAIWLYLIAQVIHIRANTHK